MKSNLGTTSLVLIFCLTLFGNLWAGNDRDAFTPDKVVIYPNPASTGDHIMISGEKDIAKLDLINIVGQQLISKETEHSKSVHLELKELKSGIYFIKVTFVDNTSVTQRVWVK